MHAPAHACARSYTQQRPHASTHVYSNAHTHTHMQIQQYAHAGNHVCDCACAHAPAFSGCARALLYAHVCWCAYEQVGEASRQLDAWASETNHPLRSSAVECLKARWASKSCGATYEQAMAGGGSGGDGGGDGGVGAEISNRPDHSSIALMEMGVGGSVSVASGGGGMAGEEGGAGETDAAPCDGGFHVVVDGWSSNVVSPEQDTVSPEQV